MRAIPQLKTQEIVGEINALQLAVPYYVDLGRIGPETQRWVGLKKKIEPMFKIDARLAWELTGALKALTGDLDGTNHAFRTSIDLGNTGTNRLNWVINLVNLGMFSAGQEAYEAVGDPDPNHINTLLGVGFLLGAVQKATRFSERALEMNIASDRKDTEELRLAQEILRQAGISDAQVAHQLDVAGAVLRKHNIRPNISPRVAAADGFFRGVTFALVVPVSAAEAFEMNVELAMQEEEAGLERDFAFDVVFEATAS